MKKEVFRMKDICKNESSLEIVRNGNFHVFENEVVGLVGKSHAGKSTLLGAGTGEFPCDSGELWICERKVRISSIDQARKEGIFLIKDESSLIGEFTIEDTMKLNFAFVKREVKYSAYKKRYRETLKLLEVPDSYDTRIRELNFHKRVLVEIAQALVCNAKLLIFDNVMSMLSSTARKQFQRVFQVLRMQGLSLILIENQVDSIRGYLNRLCVMRKGRVVAELSREEMRDELILSLSEGEIFIPRESSLQIRKPPVSKRKILEFRKVYTEDGVIKNLSLDLGERETLGIWNRNRHSGKAILDILEGRLQVISGQVFLEGVVYDCRRRGDIGIAIVPEEDELFSNMDLRDNINISALKSNAYGGMVKKEGELRYLVQELCSEYLSDKECRLFPDQMIPNNLLIRKKVSLCRAIASGAGIIVYNNPCIKMDMRENEIFQQDILKTQKENISQILISSQLDKLYPVCSRILQAEEGRIVRTIRR